MIWFRTFRKEPRLRVFENRVLRRNLGVIRRVGGTGGLRNLHSDGLLNLHFSTDIIRVMKSRKVVWVVPVACMGRIVTYTGF